MRKRESQARGHGLRVLMEIKPDEFQQFLYGSLYDTSKYRYCALGIQSGPSDIKMVTHWTFKELRRRVSGFNWF